MSAAVVLAGGVASLVSAGCHSAPSLTTQEEEGKHLYEVRCAHCHEDNDLALKKVPPNLHGIFRHPSQPAAAAPIDATARVIILKGRGQMPGFDGRFTDKQIAELLAYLHSGSF